MTLRSGESITRNSEYGASVAGNSGLGGLGRLPARVLPQTRTRNQRIRFLKRQLRFAVIGCEPARLFVGFTAAHGRGAVSPLGGSRPLAEQCVRWI
jgi:hypothetical protein